MKNHFTWIDFVKLVCAIVAVVLLVCLIVKLGAILLGRPDVLKEYKPEYLLVALAAAILLPFLSQIEAFGVKMSVREQVDNLSSWIDALPYYTLGSECERDHDNELAERYYFESLERCPTFWPSLLGLGSVYQEKKEYDKAVPYYREVLKLDPDNVYAYNNLAAIYVEAKPPLGNAETGLAFAEDALRILPSFDHAYYFKGTALNLLGRYDEAREILKGSIDRGFASESIEYWMMYELAIARSKSSKTNERVTEEKLEEILDKARNAPESELLETMSETEEQERVSSGDRKII